MNPVSASRTAPSMVDYLDRPGTFSLDGRQIHPGPLRPQDVEALTEAAFEQVGQLLRQWYGHPMPISPTAVQEYIDLELSMAGLPTFYKDAMSGNAPTPIGQRPFADLPEPERMQKAAEWAITMEGSDRGLAAWLNYAPPTRETPAAPANPFGTALVTDPAR